MMSCLCVGVLGGGGGVVRQAAGGLKHTTTPGNGRQPSRTQPCRPVLRQSPTFLVGLRAVRDTGRVGVLLETGVCCG